MTAHQKREEAQNQAGQRSPVSADQVLDELPEAVQIVDATGVVVLNNRASLEILGQEAAAQPEAREAGDSPASSGASGHADTTPAVGGEPLHQTLLTGEEVRGAHHLLRQAGTQRDIPVLVNAAPLRDPDGQIVGAVTVFQDITDLHARDDRHGEFISSAVHDLKGPLTTISGNTQLARLYLAQLALSAEATAPLLDALARIERATTRMVAVIDDVEERARTWMEAEGPPRRQATDLVILVRTVVEHHQASTTCALSVQSAIPDLITLVDPVRLERVIENLLTNAIKFSPAAGAITVTVSREEDEAGPRAVIAVADHGLGIPEADLPHIFERFRRGSNVADRIPGSGVGLASAEQIVKQHGGTLHAESREGGGTTVTVRLPVKQS